MKTYLEASGLPTTRIGEVEIPRLIMGIHPFDGYGYISPERDRQMLDHFWGIDRIVEVLSYAAGQGVTVAQSDHTAAHLNRRHLTALWKASHEIGVQLRFIPFIMIPLRLDGQPIEQRRVLATFDKNGYDRAGQTYRRYFSSDPIIDYVSGGHGAPGDTLVTFEQVPPYTPEELAHIAVDYEALAYNLGFFEGFEPLIADPGAEVDLLAAAGRFDLIEEYIAFLRKYYPAVVTSIHHPGITIPALEEADVSFDGYITPLNKPGIFMLPTPELALDAIRNSSRPIIAIKPMAGGRLIETEAFDYVLNEIGAAASMFGMGKLEEVQQTLSLAKRALEKI